MKHLPKTKRMEILDEQRLHLGAWLECRELDRELDAVPLDIPEEENGTEPETCLAAPEIAPFDPQVMVGQIRLLAHGLTPDWPTPVYVAVYSEWRPHGVMVAPFSRYPVPATQNELAFEEPEVRWRTLCLWNSFSLSPASLAKSWVVGELSPEECREARAVFRQFAFCEGLARALKERTGPPILSAKDPRLDYLEEERTRMAGLARLQRREDGMEDREWIESLIAEAEALITHTELMAADDGLTPAIPVSLVGFGEPTALVARADGPLRLQLDREDPPDVQWEIETDRLAPGVSLAGADVLLLDLQGRRLLADGKIDASGRVITLHKLWPREDSAPITSAERLVFVVVNPEAP